MFDHLVVIDWSAAATPRLGADSIWCAWLDTRTGEIDLTNIATRLAAIDVLTSRLAGANGRVLVGVDFPLGHPVGHAAAAGLVTAAEPRAWRATWSHLARELAAPPDDADDRWRVAADLNRRIGTPHYWGAPPSRAGAHLTSTRPVTRRLADDRLTEERLRAGGRRPFTVWQLLGAGSVGSQAITGIALLERLRTRFGDNLHIWPFDTGIDRVPDAPIVIAEVWPSTIDFDHVEHPVKDARQVIALAEWLADAQHTGRLVSMFTPQVDPGDVDRVVGEEGWVLGVT